MLPHRPRPAGRAPVDVPHRLDYDPYANVRFMVSEGVEGTRMRIGELAERSGRTVRTLHFYEELGLLQPVARTKGGFREYDEYALTRIEWISRLQDLGFSLPEIKAFLQGLHEKTSAPEMMKDLMEFYAKKLLETRSHIARLQRLEIELRASLDYLTGCRTCAPVTPMGACRTCAEDEHVGHPAPPLVAAVQPNPLSPPEGQ